MRCWSVGKTALVSSIAALYCYVVNTVALSRVAVLVCQGYSVLRNERGRKVWMYKMGGRLTSCFRVYSLFSSSSVLSSIFFRRASCFSSSL